MSRPTWLPTPSQVGPFSLTAIAIAAVAVGTALLLRLLAHSADWQIPAWPNFFLATLVTSIWAGRLAGAFAASLGLALAWATLERFVPDAFSLDAILFYALVSAALVAIGDHYRRLVARLEAQGETLQRHISLVTVEREVLDMIAQDRPLPETLEQMARKIEAISRDGMLASVLLIEDGHRLRHGAAPSLPTAYIEAIDGSEIGPCAGSCGTAAWRRQPVYVSDIQTDPLWVDYRQVAAGAGLEACWSTPILAKTGEVLGTFALYHHEKRDPSANEREVVGLLVRTAALAIERDRARSQSALLVRELSHRVKNVLAVVQSIASSTLRPHVPADRFADFEKRLVALARTQDLLTRPQPGVEVRDLVHHCVIDPFGAEGRRFIIQGPDAGLPPQPALALALTLHELCTNAVKYGALSNEVGQVEVSWGFEEKGGQAFFFRWLESGGPPVRPPEREGFGLKMIHRALGSTAQSEASVELRPEGLCCELRLPREQIVIRPSGAAEYTGPEASAEPAQPFPIPPMA